MNEDNPSASHLTPLMRQYYAVKSQHPDKILFFRMGDFYEMFGDDAVQAAPILGIALTSRSHGPHDRIPLAGVPYHAAERYLAKLLESGLKVVIVEQTEDPKKAKGLVKRDVVEILTPGTSSFDLTTNNTPQSSSGLAAVYGNGSKNLGLACLDFTTGAFVVDEGSRDEMLERLKLFQPSEILIAESAVESELSRFLKQDYGASRLTPFSDWHFDFKTGERDLTAHFEVRTLEGFGLTNTRLAVSAAGAIVRYLKENQRDQLGHLTKISRLNDSEVMTLDYGTVRNLELISSLANGTAENSLFSVINLCQTTAGSRRLQQALLRPFKTKTKIELRQQGVAEFVTNRPLALQLREAMKRLPDLEKLAGRLGIGRISPRQLGGIRDGLVLAKELGALLVKASSEHSVSLCHALPDPTPLIVVLARALPDDPPMTANKGGIFNQGYSEKLDALNLSIKEARTYIASLQQSERQKTGINSLKVGYNQVFGYYIEVTRTHTNSVPPDYIRKQTLVNAERYITPELKEKEELISAAEEKIFSLEESLYEDLVESVACHIASISQTGELMAEIDLIVSLAELAVKNKYVRPEIYPDTRLEITNGRHPVIEAVLPAGEFIGNETIFLSEGKRIHILTGPNMSGKSTYLRQIGLIVILAHIGSFVPADSAAIGLVDRVFTRVGALDNLARGQSTFLVEIVETANILHNATAQSLVLLDEVGRGTSTFDGLSVAWSVVEYLNEHNKSRTVFATHYHELTGLAALYDTIANYQVAVKKWQESVIFLHKIVPGGCDDSYGIEVGRLAGLPRQAITRAKQILKLLESGKFSQSEIGKSVYVDKMQPTLFDAPPSAVETALRELDLDTLSPIDAFELIRRWHAELS
ncbi:MAG: DNA mismatch repair protein MutS [candidate division Zixibacteria bacterium]|nr:DNA mismatch repair protein MutS [candidate division Zixibacteria bacterium]